MITTVDRLASRRIVESRWDEIRERLQPLMMSGLKHAKGLKENAVQKIQEDFGIDLVYAKLVVDMILNEVEKKRKKLNREGFRNHRVGGLEMTVKEAIRELQGLGMVLKRTEYGEFRVNFKGGSEATAYYTDDLDDAVGTARAMSKEQRPQGSRRKATVDWIDIENAVDDFIRTGKSLEEVTVEDVARSLGHLNHGEATKAMTLVLKKMKEKLGEGDLRDRDPQPNQMLGSRRKQARTQVDRLAASKALDRISDHIEGLRREMPREASNLRGLALRLDRVANTLEAEQEVTERVSKIENELDGLGVDFTVGPNSSDKQATCIYAYKGQLGSLNEVAVLSRIAKKHGSLFENMRSNRTYKITVPHHI